MVSGGREDGEYDDSSRESGNGVSTSSPGAYLVEKMYRRSLWWVLPYMKERLDG